MLILKLNSRHSIAIIEQVLEDDINSGYDAEEVVNSQVWEYVLTLDK